MKHLFILGISFKSHLIRHSRTEGALKDTQRALEHLRHSESTGTVRYSEGTRRALGHLGTQRALGGHSEGTRRALGGHSEGA